MRALGPLDQEAQDGVRPLRRHEPVAGLVAEGREIDRGEGVGRLDQQAVAGLHRKQLLPRLQDRQRALQAAEVEGGGMTPIFIFSVMASSRMQRVRMLRSPAIQRRLAGHGRQTRAIAGEVMGILGNLRKDFLFLARIGRALRG